MGLSSATSTRRPGERLRGRSPSCARRSSASCRVRVAQRDADPLGERAAAHRLQRVVLDAQLRGIARWPRALPADERDHRARSAQPRDRPQRWCSARQSKRMTSGCSSRSTVSRAERGDVRAQRIAPTAGNAEATATRTPCSCRRRRAAFDRRQRQFDPEARAMPGRLTRPTSPPIAMRKPLDDGEPKARAAMPARHACIGLRELLEDQRLLFRRNAWPGIANGEAQARPPGRGAISSTTPPASVNFTALPARLNKICRKRPSSPITRAGASAAHD